MPENQRHLSTIIADVVICIYEPGHEKPNVFSEQISYKHRGWLETGNFLFRNKRNCTMSVVKTKALSALQFSSVLLFTNMQNVAFLMMCLTCFLSYTNEPPHGKTNNLHRRKQRRRSASQ